MNNNLCNGKLYTKNENGEFKELGVAGELELSDIDIDLSYDEFLKGLCIDEPVTITCTPTYKEFHRKRKGKRYIHYPIIRKGFSPKILALLTGGKE